MTPETWAAALGESPFMQVAAYDGEQPGRPPVAVGTPGRLMWHELALV